MLKNSEPVSITGEEYNGNDDLKEYRKNAKKYGLAIRGKYTNKNTGKEIFLSKGSINEIISHDFSKAQLQSIAAIPEIIEKAVYIETIQNLDKQKHNDVISYDYYVCGLNIGGVDYTVKAVVGNTKNEDRYYDHKLSKIEKGDLIEEIRKTEKLLPGAHGITNPGLANNNSVFSLKNKRLLSILQIKNKKNWMRTECLCGKRLKSLRGIVGR